MIETAKVFFAATILTVSFLMLQAKAPVHNALIYIFLCAYGAFFLCLYYGEKHKSDNIDDIWRNRTEGLYQELAMYQHRTEMLERSTMPRIPDMPDMPDLHPLTTQPAPAAEPIRITDELIAELDKRYITLAQADKRYQKVSKLERILTPTKEKPMEE